MDALWMLLLAGAFLAGSSVGALAFCLVVMSRSESLADNEAAE